MTPAEWMEKVPVKIDENKAIGADSKLVKFYAEQKEAKGLPFKKNSPLNDDDFQQP